MRNMSFSMTTEAYKNRTKTVTRRLGWGDLKPGDVFMGVEKGMGLKKGQHVTRLGAARVVSAGWEPLSKIHQYGPEELVHEGFPDMTAEEFVGMFMMHNDCHPSSMVMRIEFEHIK
jgi:hypothetical protein